MPYANFESDFPQGTLNAEHKEEIILFGPFRLIPARRRLERNGLLVRLGDRALDILHLLILEAPQIVSKSRLLAEVWSDVTVDEGNLRFQVTCLRKAFGKEQIISTVKGRGYCFVAPFSRASDGDSATAGEEDVARAAHARHYGGFFDRLYDDFETMSRSEWTRVGRPEIDNFRAALSWALDRPERREFAISLVGAGGRLMLKLGLIGEGRRYGEQLLDAVGPDVPLDIAARFLRQSGALWVTSDYALALPLLARSVSLYRQLGDRRSHAGVMTMIGYIETAKGEYEAARNTLEEAWQILEQFDAKKELYSTTLNLGILCSRMDRMEEARTYFAKALEIARAIEDHDSESLTLLNLADLECG